MRLLSPSSITSSPPTRRAASCADQLNRSADLDRESLRPKPLRSWAWRSTLSGSSPAPTRAAVRSDRQPHAYSRANPGRGVTARSSRCVCRCREGGPAEMQCVNAGEVVYPGRSTIRAAAAPAGYGGPPGRSLSSYCRRGRRSAGSGAAEILDAADGKCRSAQRLICSRAGSSSRPAPASV